jgi:sarcosine oxidase
VLLIGPGEPQGDWATHEGIFASHYDEGRITRALDPNAFWSRVSRASIARYGEIAQISGVQFFQEVGSLIAGPAGGETMTNLARVAGDAGIAAEWLDAQGCAARFPYLRLGAEDRAAFEPRGAGHISPRKLVRAQGICAEAAGARIIPQMVQGVDPKGGAVVLRLEDQRITVDHALFATGAFCRQLLGAELAEIEPMRRTVAFFRLGAAEQARLKDMPTLIHKTTDDERYMLPPITYPDGQSYIKIGGESADVVVKDPAELADWYRSGGDAQVGEELREALLRRLPDLRYEAMHIAPCATTFTPEDKPRIGPFSDGISVAVAACGRGAKCSDELGRMAAEAVLSGVTANVADAA